MEGGLRLNSNDERRIAVLTQVVAGQLTCAAAAVLMGVGERQARRLVAAYREHGPRGVIHGNRGRQPAHAVPDTLRAAVVALASGPYAGVNHSHLAELLAEREGITLPRSTVSDILRAVGIRSPRPQKRRSKHRSRRERYPQEGMLVQADGSHHDWLQGRGPRLVLLAVIDDATGKVPTARFELTEDTRGYFRLLRDLCGKVGVPHAFYSDKHAIFWPTHGETLAEQLAGRRSPTQFGRAMAELGVQMIPSHSPQARGRIERLWGTLQDRLVSELRLEGISTIDEANAFLPRFLGRFNKTFAVTPQLPGTVYRPRLSKAQLDRTLCFKHERVVANDNTVKVDDLVLQLLPNARRAGYAKATVTIHEALDRRCTIYYRDQLIPSRLLTLRDRLTPPRRKPRPRPITPPPTPIKPAADHPWRQYPAVTKSLGT